MIHSLSAYSSFWFKTILDDPLIECIQFTEPQCYSLFSTPNLVTKLSLCELKSYTDQKPESNFSAFQQGVCQISISTQSRDMAKKAKTLDKMTYGISELMTSDRRTDRQTD